MIDECERMFVLMKSNAIKPQNVRPSEPRPHLIRPTNVLFSADLALGEQLFRQLPELRISAACRTPRICRGAGGS